MSEDIFSPPSLPLHGENTRPSPEGGGGWEENARECRHAKGRKVFTWPIRVYWEDTDAGGVVYYANYLKFLERARTEWLSALGLEQDRLAEEAGVVFVVRRVEADYLRPARFNDRLGVDCELASLSRVSLTMIQRVWRGEEVLLEGVVKVVCVDRSAFRPARIPEFVMRAFETGMRWISP